METPAPARPPVQGKVIPIQPVNRRPRATPKGRQVRLEDRDFVSACCTELAPRPDVLIEHLHRLQDAEGGLRRGRLAALAERLRLSQVEVYEVATFYHHFDVVDDDTELPATTVRVCTSLSCQMAGAQSLLADLQQRLAQDGRVRVVEAPCVGQCHRAPAACVGQRQVPEATADGVQ
ncbi:NADH-quinone oxidoreductase subunit NuoE family protein, partial [Macromonas nakdongensis]|uniref:NADH-quinone oxidoreductase subunit NuoE family protein n=1 Tax=Macromonas nakdongensis TaxID=1843082 RepID=UPI0018E37956